MNTLLIKCAAIEQILKFDHLYYTHAEFGTIFDRYRSEIRFIHSFALGISI